MEAGGEAEPHPDLVDAPGHPGRPEVGDHTQRLQHVGRAHGRGRGPPTVLAHLGPGGCHHQGGDGGDIDTAQAVASGATGVDDLEPGRQVEGEGVGQHGPNEAGQLLHRLALGPERGDQGGDLGRRGLTVQDLAHHRLGPGRGERLPGQQGGQHSGPGAQRLEGGDGGIRGGRHQSHHRSWPSTPRAMSPSCTWEVPSTMVSCLASRYQSSVGWSSM